MVRSPLLRKAAFVTAVFLGGSVAGIAVYGPALAVQTHMQSALTALNNARNQLNMAEPDKGGHRANAIGLVNQAISQVQAGIAAGAQ